MERHPVRSARRTGYHLVLVLAVATVSCSLTPAPASYEVKVPSGVVPRTGSSTIERVAALHIESHPDVYPIGTTHRILSMEWLRPTDEWATPDGGGFGFKEPTWAVTIDGPVRGIPGDSPPGPINVIMISDGTARVWGWTP